MKKIIVVASAFFVGIILTSVLGCVHRHSAHKEPFSTDAAVLQAAILSSNRISVFDAKLNKVLFESQDTNDIQWLSEVFIAEIRKPYMRLQSKMRYRLIFYDDSKITAEIGFKQGVKFYWVDPAWSYKADFYLTSASYGEVLPWLCEKSGENLNELFPVKDWIKGIRKRPPKQGKVLWDDGR